MNESFQCWYGPEMFRTCQGKVQEQSFKGLDYGNRYFQTNEEAFGGRSEWCSEASVTDPFIDSQPASIDIAWSIDCKYLWTLGRIRKGWTVVVGTFFLCSPVLKVFGWLASIFLKMLMKHVETTNICDCYVLTVMNSKSGCVIPMKGPPWLRIRAANTCASRSRAWQECSLAMASSAWRWRNWQGAAVLVGMVGCWFAPLKG